MEIFCIGGQSFDQVRRDAAVKRVGFGKRFGQYGAGSQHRAMREFRTA